MVLLDLVDSTPQSLSGSDKELREFQEHRIHHVTECAKRHGFERLDDQGDADLLFHPGDSAQPLLDLFQDLVQRNPVPAYLHFQPVQRMVAHYNRFAFSVRDAEGHRKQLASNHLTLQFRFEKACPERALLVTRQLYELLRDQVPASWFHCTKPIPPKLKDWCRLSGDEIHWFGLPGESLEPRVGVAYAKLCDAAQLKEPVRPTAASGHQVGWQLPGKLNAALAVAGLAALLFLALFFKSGIFRTPLPTAPKLTCVLKLPKAGVTNAPVILTKTGQVVHAKGQVDYSVTAHYPTNTSPDPLTRLVIFNEGPSKAVAVSVFHKVHAFYPSDGAYAITLGLSTELHPAIVFKSELPVGFDHAITETVPSLSGIAVHVVDLSYHSEHDLKRLIRRELLVSENNRLLTGEEFKKHRLYEKISEKLAWLDTVQPKKIN